MLQYPLNPLHIFFVRSDLLFSFHFIIVCWRWKLKLCLVESVAGVVICDWHHKNDISSSNWALCFIIHNISFIPQSCSQLFDFVSTNSHMYTYSLTIGKRINWFRLNDTHGEWFINRYFLDENNNKWNVPFLFFISFNQCNQIDSLRFGCFSL